MRLDYLLSIFLFVFVAECLPGHHGHHARPDLRQHATTSLAVEHQDSGREVCLPIPAVFEGQEDVVAKVRPAEGSCQPGEHVVALPSSSLAELSPLILHGRQAEDPYACSQSKPCGNKACCGKTGVCGYGPDYCGTNNKSPNDKCWSNCDAKAE